MLSPILEVAPVWSRIYISEGKMETSISRVMRYHKLEFGPNLLATLGLMSRDERRKTVDHGDPSPCAYLLLLMPRLLWHSLRS